MKFLVLTDLHQKTSRIEQINRIIADERPDHILFLGDVTDMGTGEDAVDILSSIHEKTYVIPGNCDSRDFPDKISQIAYDLHGKAKKIGEYDLIGLGGSNITIFGTPIELTEDEIYNALKPISKKGMILMTHVPSYGIFDKIPNGTSVGSHAVKKIVDEFHPIIALSGHVHEDRGSAIIDGTLFCNPGPAKDGYSAIITIENGKAEAKLLGPLN